MLHEFLAVTMTSVYHIKDGVDENGNFFPTAIKIAVMGDSKIPVGRKLEGGRVIAIYDHLMACSRNDDERVTISERPGCHSSLIVALFTDPRKARECFEYRDLKPCDARWAEETLGVLEEIGDNHPAFYICRKAGICLPVLV